MELEGTDPSGAARLEHFTCGHRIAGSSDNGVSEVAAFRRLMTRAVGKLRTRSSSGVQRVRDAVGMRIRDELGKIKR